MGPLGETIAQNPAAIALLGDETHYTGPMRSATYRWFTDPTSRSLYPQDDHEHHSRVHVSQLRTASARLDPASTTPLILHLRKHSAEVARLWEVNEVGVRHSEEKRFTHPEVGDLALFCQVALDPDEMQTLLVFTATPGTISAERLRLLTVVGATALTTR